MASSSQITLRPYTPGDAPAVVELINAAAYATSGLRRAVVDGVGAIRLARYVPAAAERIVAANAENLLVGYAYLAPMDYSILFETGGAVHPAYQGHGIGSRLVAWARERATTLAEQAPNGVQVLLQANLLETEQPAIALYTEHGFERVREWVHMQIEFDNPPPAPQLPSHLTARPMDLEQDWEIVGPAMDEAFADHWGTIPPLPEAAETSDEQPEEDDIPVDSSYSNAPGFCFIICDNQAVVGGVLCNAKLVERSDTGRVGSIFVRPSYRKQGIGRALMAIAFGAFWEQGVRRVILDTDSQSFTAAPRFYQSLGMRPYRREWLYEAIVRPGRELRRLVKP